MERRRPNFNQAVRALIKDVAKTMPEFAHVRASRILVVAGEARRASRATVKPLVFSQGARSGRRSKTRVRFKGRRMLYCITLRPLFFRASTPKARIATLVHELFHISPRFDGSLHPGRRHGTAGKKFGRRLRPLVRRYLRHCPPELWAEFAYNGEVRALQWLERPSGLGARSQEKLKALYTEADLFLGPVRMVTQRARPATRHATVRVH